MLLLVMAFITTGKPTKTTWLSHKSTKFLITKNECQMKLTETGMNMCIDRHMAFISEYHLLMKEKVN